MSSTFSTGPVDVPFEIATLTTRKPRLSIAYSQRPSALRARPLGKALTSVRRTSQAPPGRMTQMMPSSAFQPPDSET